MRESIGSVALYNIIIVFIVVTFAILAGTMSYSKAFKVNNRIINAIEKYEGYNDLAATDIDTQLMSIGYQMQNRNYNCPSTRKGVQLYNDNNFGRNYNPNYEFCIYKNGVTTSEWNGRYVEYGVVSYIYIDIPIIGEFLRIPVYGKTRKIFEFDPTYTPALPETVYSINANYADSMISEFSQYTGLPIFYTKPNSDEIKNYLVVTKTNGIYSFPLANQEYYVKITTEHQVDKYLLCTMTIISDYARGSAGLSYLLYGANSCT